MGLALNTLARFIFIRLGQLTALVTAIAFSASLIHDWGYFDVIGSEYRALETVTDYLSSALQWMPQTLALIMAFVLFSWIARLASEVPAQPVTVEQITTGQKAEPEKRYRVAGSLLVLLILGLPVSAYMFASQESGILLLLVPFAWFLVLPTILIFVFGTWPPRPRDDLFPIYIITWIAPALFAFLLLLGDYHARTDLTRTDADYSLSTKSTKGAGPSTGAPDVVAKVRVLRVLDRGILVSRSQGDQVEFIPWDSVHELGRPIKLDLLQKPLGCRTVSLC
jgi:hypothetical protein